MLELLVVEALFVTTELVVIFVVFKFVIVPLAAVRFVVEAVITLRSVIVVVARIDVPVAVKLPVTKLDVVALSAIKLLKNPENAEKIFARKLVEVA